MKITKSRKVASRKARVMWGLYDGPHCPIITGNQRLIRICEKSTNRTAIRVAVIPLDDVETLVELASHAITSARVSGVWMGTETAARAALHAIGIPCKRRARK